jgi:hypothetical protein
VYGVWGNPMLNEEICKYRISFFPVFIYIDVILHRKTHTYYYKNENAHLNI